MLDSTTSQSFTAESALEAVGNVLAFPGLPEPTVFDGCNRAINVIYWTLLLFAAPFAVYEHLVANYTPVGWLHLIVPLLYVPVAKGWFPKAPAHRFFIGGVALTLIGLSINALYGWETQPGIYIMMPPALIAFALYGGRALVWVTIAQMVPVAVTCLLLNPHRPITGVIIGCSTWIAVNLAGAILVNRVLVSSRERAQELEYLSDRLLDSEERLQENDRSLRHMVAVSLQEIEEAMQPLEKPTPANEATSVALTQIRAAMAKLHNSAT